MKKPTSLIIDEDIYRKIKKLAIDKKMKLHELVNMIFVEFLEKSGGK